MSFCENCLESSLNLSKLVEQLSNLKREILDLTKSFSELISQRRNEAVAIQNNQKSDDNTNYSTPTAQKSNHEDSERHQQYLHFNEFVKCELKDEVPENEDLFTNLFVGEPEECNLNNENDTENATDPLLGVIDAEFNHRKDKSLKPKMIPSKFPSGLTTFVSSLNTGFTRVQNDTVISSTSSASSIFVESLNLTLNTIDDSSTSMEGANGDNSTFENPSQIIIEDESKPHMCTLCNKKFRNSSMLKTHSRIHTGEKPFQCSICKKSFSDASSFRRHKKTHTGEKPHKCSYCERSFIQVGQRKIHEKRIHTGIKPFQCSYCEMAFRFFNLQTEHEITYHKSEFKR